MANVNVTFTLDSTHIPRLLVALAQKYGCEPTAVEVKAAIQKDWKDTVLAYEKNQAELAALKAVAPTTPITIT